MTRTPVPPDKILEHYSEQLQLLQSACDLFDKGQTAQYKIIATLIRVLLHEKGQSKALLKQVVDLGLASQPKFIDSAMPHSIANMVGQSLLVKMVMFSDGAKYFPFLDELAFGMRDVEFEDWWNKRIVIVQADGTQATRSKLVLWVADQGGGAHVDKAIDPQFSNLIYGDGAGYKYGDGKTLKPIPDLERGSIRQIAHEVLRTLVPNYSKMPDPKWFEGAQLQVLYAGANNGSVPDIGGEEFWGKPIAKDPVQENRITLKADFEVPKPTPVQPVNRGAQLRKKVRSPKKRRNRR